MSKKVELTSEERRTLREAVRDVLKEDEQSVERFLPLPMHQRVVDPSQVLVVGERGAGKTALFEFLNALKGRSLQWSDIAPAAGLSRAAPGGPTTVHLEGHGSGRGNPDPMMLARGIDSVEMARLWWVGRLVQRLSAWNPDGRMPPLPASARTLASLDANQVQQTAHEARAHSAAVMSWLEVADDALASQQVDVTFIYDYLDRVGRGANLNRAVMFSRALVSLWMDLRPRLRHLHGKVFLRPDLLDRAASGWPDGSKWRQRAVELRWSGGDLYRVLLRHLGTSAPVRQWLTREPGALPFKQDRNLGWLPVFSLPERGQQTLFRHSDPDLGGSVEGPSQRALARKLAGEVMGSGKKKGYTHRWMINHILDGQDEAVPRSLMNLVREAAASAVERGASDPPGLQLFWPSDLERAKTPTGRLRLAELQEAHPVVMRLEALRGCQTPFEQDDIVGRLSRPPSSGAPEVCDGDGLGGDGREALKLLMGLGTLYERSTRRRGRVVDVPELLRAALDIKRKGGVSRS